MLKIEKLKINKNEKKSNLLYTFNKVFNSDVNSGSFIVFWSDLEVSRIGQTAVQIHFQTGATIFKTDLGNKIKKFF